MKEKLDSVVINGKFHSLFNENLPLNITTKERNEIEFLRTRIGADSKFYRFVDAEGDACEDCAFYSKCFDIETDEINEYQISPCNFVPYYSKLEETKRISNNSSTQEMFEIEENNHYMSVFIVAKVLTKLHFRIQELLGTNYNKMDTKDVEKTYINTFRSLHDKLKKEDLEKTIKFFNDLHLQFDEYSYKLLRNETSNKD